MDYEIYPTTAEHIVGATDVVLLKNKGCNIDFVASFLDIPPESAKNACKMAEQLGLVKTNGHGDIFYPDFPFASYLVTSNEQQKSAIMRLVLEQYEPFKTFKNRLIVVGLMQTAAEQTKIFHNLSAHRDVIKDTITSLGTFSQSLVSKGAGLYTIAELPSERNEFLLRIKDVVANRERAEIVVRQLLGEKAQSFIDTLDVLEPLITSYQKLSDSKIDPRSPILYAGNSFESFLVQVAKEKGVKLERAHGINAKIDRLGNEGHILKKHKFMSKYLGHIRNACDHGVDEDIGESWTITEKTSHEYVHVTMSCIANIVESMDGKYIL